jgi:hypothetical protein
MKNKLRAARFSIIILSCSLLFTNLDCKKDNESQKIDSLKDKKYKIQFVKQGEVYFQDRNKTLIKQIDAEIAESPERRHTGLMYRDDMLESQGMLFIFEKEEPEGFYMKNTIIPLDIIFINSKKEIVKIYKNTTPYSEQDLPSIKPILYVVEVKAGFCDKYNIKEGSYIDWRRE